MRRGGRFFYESERKRDPENEASDEADSQCLRRSPSEIDLTYYDPFTTREQLASWMATVKGKTNARPSEMLADFSPETTHSTSGAAHARSQSVTEIQPTAVALLDHTSKNSKLDSFKSWLSRRLQFISDLDLSGWFFGRSRAQKLRTPRDLHSTHSETSLPEQNEIMSHDQHPTGDPTMYPMLMAEAVRLIPVKWPSTSTGGSASTIVTIEDKDLPMHDGYREGELSGFDRALALVNALIAFNEPFSGGSESHPVFMEDHAQLSEPL